MVNKDEYKEPLGGLAGKEVASCSPRTPTPLSADLRGLLSRSLFDSPHWPHKTLGPPLAAWGVMGVTSFARSCYYRQRVRLHLGDDDARGGVCVYGRWKDGWMAVQSLQPRRRRKDSATTGDFLTRYRAAASSTLRYERNSASALTVGPKNRRALINAVLCT